MTATEKPDSTKSGTAGRGWGRIAFALGAGAAILVVVIWLARDAGNEIKAAEGWISGHGILGPIVFFSAAVILTSVFVPSTVLAAVAGALFGLGWGTVAMSAAGITGAAFNYAIAHKFLRERIANVLQRHPKLLAIQRAVQREGWRLQFMLRLAPINAVSVNYILGAAGLRFPSYLLATLGLIPGLFVEVYFGHVAKHVAKSSAGVSSDSTPHLVLTITGFLVCVILMILIGRTAQRAIAEAEAGGD